MADGFGGAPAGGDADDVAFDEGVVGVGYEVGLFGGEVLDTALVPCLLDQRVCEGGCTFRNFLFHS